MEHPTKMDDLGIPLFSEKPKFSFREAQPEAQLLTMMQDREAGSNFFESRDVC